MVKTIVYTAITGNYEKPIREQCTDGADFVLFTENFDDISPWEGRQVIDLFKDPRRNSRYHKLIPSRFFPEYDYHIWMDGSMELKVPAQTLIDELWDNDIMVFKHSVRDCAYKEAVECLRLKLDDPVTINDYLNKLKRFKYPEHNGLGETKVVVRRNTPKVHRFNKDWFYELMTGSLRDQISFNFAVYLNNLKVKYMPPIHLENDWFIYHKKEHKRTNTDGERV